MGDKRDRAARTPESAGPSAVNTDRQTPAKNAVLERDGQADARAARYVHREQREVDAVRALYQADPRKRYAHGERGREKLREKREIDKVLRFRVHGLDLAADLDTSNGTPLADKQEGPMQAVRAMRSLKMTMPDSFASTICLLMRAARPIVMCHWPAEHHSHQPHLWRHTTCQAAQCGVSSREL